MLRISIVLTAAVAASSAFAQDPANPNTPDGTRPAPIEIVMSQDGQTPACAPETFRIPVDNMVVLLLRNGGGGTLDFTAPELFETSLIADRQGGQAWVTEDGALLARVPPAGSVEIAMTAMKAGTFDYACVIPGMPEMRATGTIETVPTPSDG